jgi:hypothetical protein
LIPKVRDRFIPMSKRFQRRCGGRKLYRRRPNFFKRLITRLVRWNGIGQPGVV